MTFSELKKSVCVCGEVLGGEGQKRLAGLYPQACLYLLVLQQTAAAAFISGLPGPSWY